MLIGRCLSALATALIPTTLTLAVLRATDDGGALGIVLASELVPMLLLLPVGGVLADRLRPERVALFADLVRGLSQAAIAVELLLGLYRLVDLALLSALAGAAIAFGSPAVPRLVVAVVPGPARLRMNARIGVVTSLSSVAAPAIAGTVTVAAGPGWAAGLTAVLFAGSALTLGGIRTSIARRAEGFQDAEQGAGVQGAEDGAGVRGAEDDGAGVRGAEQGAGVRGAEGGVAGRRVEGSGVEREAEGRGTFSAFGRDLRRGWREIRQRPWFLACVFGHGVWHFVAGLFLTLAPVTVVQDLGGETNWMVIVQSGTVGMVLGVFAAPRLPIRRPLAVMQVGAAAYLLPMAALAVPGPVAVLAVAYFAAMFGLGVLIPLWETVVAEEIPERALGRVRSFDTLISFASRPFGLAVAAPLAGLTGVTALAVVGGVLVAAANLAAIAWSPTTAEPRARPRDDVDEQRPLRRGQRRPSV
ncbi:MFS transporter [Nonomuraea fuscirosea]|uniref:MFS transporter n=1 Tax=Nonomuraea fuscirosea TaxID=1291556 RepID=UPI002DD85BBE|nr:MFS transporter [Nonomuraea fuscirosea]WSA49267.1 MFS transporter [Nonomuraea fuscirosea]